MTRGEIWVDFREAQRLMSCSPAQLTAMWQRGRLQRRKISGKKSRNGKGFEYLLSSLPSAARDRFNENVLAAPVVGNFELAASSAQPVAPHCAPTESRLLSPKQEAVAMQRRTILKPLVAVAAGRLPGVRFADGRAVRTLRDAAEWVAIHEEISVATVRRYWHAYNRSLRGELHALAPARRSDMGVSRVFKKFPVAAAFLQRKFLEERLSMKMAWEALCREWKNIASGEPPSYTFTRGYLNALPEPMRVLAREGKEAHERKCSPFVQRSPVAAMEWWIGDHRTFDVLTRNTLFAERKPDEPYRVWLTAIYDWGSRKIVGWCFAPTPSSRTINSALRLAVLSHGFPRNFYWDRGEDYKKVRRDLEAVTLSEEASAVLMREGAAFGVTTALPKRPRSKPIEAYFTRWSKRFDVLWRPAYLGNRPGSCPESGRTAQALHQKYLKGKRADSPLPTDAEFILCAMQWIEEFNDTQLPALQGRTPNEVMNEQWPERSRPRLNPRLLDVLFCEKEERVVKAGGCVQLDRMRYEPTEASLLAMDVRKGQQVVVLRDPYNLGDAAAFDPETLQFIGELRIQELVAQCPGGMITRDQIRSGMRRERALRRGYAEYLAALSALATNLGWKTEREELLERALQRTGTDGGAALQASAIPGAARGELAGPRSMQHQALASAFVSDDVAEDAEIFRHIELED